MILCCGEALIDLLPRNSDGLGDVFLPVAGGSVFNTAIALGRLGEETGFFSALSNDRFGRQLEKTLKAAGVDCTLCCRSDKPTTLAFMELTNGQANYTFYDENTAGQMLSSNDLPIISANVKAMQFGGISLISEPCGSAYEALMQRNANDKVIYLDPNIRQNFITDPDLHKARIRRMIGLSDIVKVSDEDLAWIEPEIDEESAIKKWIDGDTSIVLITRGEDGSEAHTQSGMVKMDAKPAIIADTIGAGDSFNAGFLSGLRQSGLLNKSALAGIDNSRLLPALKLAAQVAAITVTRSGADAPWRNEL